ncbi:MAG: hypothetical protein E6R03_07490 [Hyphomicrobiaceae bacterium]|nr:MAG: hypothetical protein E6R03_07490 [Hyphomicrobiaceae bacterium]
MFEVKDGVPLPKRSNSGLTAAVRKMVPTQMIEVPIKGSERGLRATVYQTARRVGVTVTIEKTGEVLRVWRTA